MRLPAQLTVRKVLGRAHLSFGIRPLALLRAASLLVSIILGGLSGSEEQWNGDQSISRNTSSYVAAAAP